MDKFLAWFTPSRRNAVYVLLRVALTLAAAYGIVSAEDATQAVEAVALILGVGGLTMASRFVSDGGK